MKTRVPLLLICVFLIAPVRAAADGPGDSVVKVMAEARYPNVLRPWAKSSPMDSVGAGVVIDGKRILTCAHLVAYASEVHVQARPGSDKIPAKVKTLGTDIDLAVLTVDTDAFFKQQPALPLAKKQPKVQDSVAVYGFPIGGNDLSVTKGVISRIDFGPLFGRNISSYLQVSAAINPGNSGGPAVVDNAMVGIAISRLRAGENIGFIIPNEEIELFLKDIRNGHYEGRLKDESGTAVSTPGK